MWVFMMCVFYTVVDVDRMNERRTETLTMCLLQHTWGQCWACAALSVCVLDVGDTMWVVVVSWQAKTLSTDDNYLQITHLVQLQALSADQWYYHCVCTVGKLLTACLRVDIGWNDSYIWCFSGCFSVDDTIEMLCLQVKVILLTWFSSSLF